MWKELQERQASTSPASQSTSPLRLFSSHAAGWAPEGHACCWGCVWAWTLYFLTSPTQPELQGHSYTWHLQAKDPVGSLSKHFNYKSKHFPFCCKSQDEKPALCRMKRKSWAGERWAAVPPLLPVPELEGWVAGRQACHQGDTPCWSGA